MYPVDHDDGDTADSLEIKPPQAVVRHHKSSSHRKEKHADRERRSEKERKSSRHHDRSGEERHGRDKQHIRHQRHEIDSTKRAEGHSKRSRESRHKREERNASDRALEDLRERLLDKKRNEFKMEVRRESTREETRERREPRDHRRVMEDTRERHEAARMTMDEQRNMHNMEREMYEFRGKQNRLEQIPLSPEEERPPKRHKKSRKHERHRDREREKIGKDAEIRDRQVREVTMHMVNAFTEMAEMEVEEETSSVQPQKIHRELTEQELRRQKLLDIDREMAIRKEISRQELEARRLKRVEKQQHISIEPVNPSIVDLSDDSPTATNSNPNSPKSTHSEKSSHDERDPDQGDSQEDSSDSSSSSSSDDSDDDSEDSNKDSDSNDNSDYNNHSPLSVDQLAKSDHSEADSPGHVDTNGGAKTQVVEEAKEQEVAVVEDNLPPYFPAVQGCRSVEEYKCLNRIAEGTYGVVYRAEDRRTKEIVALKRLKMEKEKDGFPITSLREINTLLKAQHPNIVTVREIVVGSNMDRIFIVMDYVEHDLKSLMETMKSKNQYFLPAEIKCLMQQLLRAVAHLHDNWILHRDLKTSNLLLSHRGILKVGDFGLAREYGSPLKQYTSIVVTLWYRAPELLLGGKDYSTPVDMWSVGCIFAELFRMEALFPGKSEIDLLNKIFKEMGTPTERIWPGYSKLPVVKKVPFSQYAVNNLRQKFTVSLSDLGFELLNKFLTYDPQQRITAEDAIKHPYFTESPLPIDPSMFPTWPAKSEFRTRVLNASPKPPSGGREFKQLGDEEDADVNASGFHMGSREASRQPAGGGFYLKF